MKFVKKIILLMKNMKLIMAKCEINYRQVGKYFGQNMKNMGKIVLSIINFPLVYN